MDGNMLILDRDLDTIIKYVKAPRQHITNIEI
jgi:hypothetical protein